MPKGSQLSQLKSELAHAGFSRQDSTGKKRKRAASQEVDKDKKASKIQEITQRLNPFDVKITKVKHEVGGRKVKGATGKPTISKQTGIEHRKMTLLKEYERKHRSGGIVDRRFGENDTTMTPEERMLERFTKEKQRTSKGVAFNLEDEEELTHYGQSLSNLDDFDGTSLALDEEESDGQIDRDTVRKVHFGGFEDDDDNDDNEHPRKKTKAEVMAEIIAKSKEHKFQRQMERKQDENARNQLDQDFENIRSLLTADPNTTGTNSIPLGRVRPDALDASTILDRTKAEDWDYDQHVRELALDKRAKPKDRTKTEEELAANAKEALEKAERKRLKRMMGEEDLSSDDEDKKRFARKKARKEHGGDDLNDDFEENEGILGTGLGEGPPSKLALVDSEESNGESSDISGDSDGGELDCHDEHELLLPTASVQRVKARLDADPKELPFTFPCPDSNEEFMAIVGDIEDKDVPTVVTRIRALYHPSLAEGNSHKLQTLTTVLIDYILHVMSPPEPRFSIMSALVPHIRSLTRAYPIKSAQCFLSKLNVMQKNLTKGLAHGALSTESRTWPGPAELAILHLVGSLWPTSDLNHAVVSPTRLLMGEYLGLGRIRNVSDLASGLFICTLFLQYESLSKRLVPECINFLTNSVLHLAPHSFVSATSLPAYFPSPDFGSELCESLRIHVKRAKSLNPKPPHLIKLLATPSNDSDQDKVDLLGISFRLLGRFADLYRSTEGFTEIFQPVLDVLTDVSHSKLSSGLQAEHTVILEALRRQLKFSLESRKPLMLQAHKPIPIASYVPKFESSSSSYLRRQDPDHERAAASKLRYQYKQEKKGAMRELRKDTRFLAAVQQKEQQEKDRGYKERMNRVFNSLEGERAEQKQMEKMKEKEKRRAGRK